MTVFSDEQLSAYIDGEADAKSIAAIELALETDVDLAARLEQLATADTALRKAFDLALGSAPMTSPQAVKTPQAGPTAPTLRRPRAAGPLGRWVLPLAATLVVGVVAGAMVESRFSPAFLLQTSSGPVAGRELASALSATRSGERRRAQGVAVQVALSFQAKDGQLCRQFGAEFSAGAATGVACRGARGWRIEGWSTRQLPGTDGYRTAAGPDDPVVSAQLERLGVVRLLDRDGESAAIRAGWRTAPER